MSPLSRLSQVSRKSVYRVFVYYRGAILANRVADI